MEVALRDADPVSPRSAVRNAFVTVNIIRNEFSPVFTVDSCDVALTQFTNNQFFLVQVSATDGDSPVSAGINGFENSSSIWNADT